MTLDKLLRTIAPVALAAGMYAQPANAATVMTVDGPVITTSDYISNGTDTLGNPILEDRWAYTVGNMSDPADINNMIDFKLSAGSNANVLGLLKDYEGSGTINLTNTVDSSGFSGLLYPDYGIPQENHVTLYLITPSDTPSAPGLATATARGIGNTIPFNSVPVNVPAPIIPEPSALLMLGIAAGGAALYRRRDRNTNYTP